MAAILGQIFFTRSAHNSDMLNCKTAANWQIFTVNKTATSYCIHHNSGSAIYLHFSHIKRVGCYKFSV